MESLAHVVSTWEDVLAQLRRKTVSWRGNSLSDRDRDTLTEAIVMCSLHLTDLSSRYVGVGSEREIIAWAHLCASLDVSALGSFLSDAVTVLRSVAEPTTYNWFKLQLSERYPFVGAFCAPVRNGFSEFLENPSPRGFYLCYQFLSFLTHVTLVDITLDLEPEYEETESYLQSLTYQDQTLDELNAIMREWMRGFTLTGENFYPSHGPGTVAERVPRSTPLMKYEYLGTDTLIDYVFSHNAGIDVTSYYPRQYSLLDSILEPPRFRSSVSWQRQSVLVFVPKSMKTRRTISKEPATLMYLQQGVSRALMDFVHRSPHLKGHIDLRVQEKNASLAIRSSATGRFATIDLSSASDTVTTRLVKAVFRGTSVYPYLVALRSRTVLLPSGKVLVTAKYAPMGSALCFPVETLIFACAVELAVRRRRSATGLSYPRWRVYGDDIIVQTPLFEDVSQTLVELGFILNRSKSFSTPSRFRESCGGEGYDGVDVTPLRISRRFASPGELGITSRHAALYMGLVDFANQAELYKFPLLRTWIIRVILGNSVAPPLFSMEGHGALYSSWPDNYRARCRRNFRLQRQEVQVAMGQPSGKRPGDTVPDVYRYFETLRLSQKRDGDMFDPAHRISVPCGSSEQMLRKKWVETPTFSVRS